MEGSKKAQEIKHSLSRTLKQLRNEKLGLTTKEMFRNLTLGPTLYQRNTRVVYAILTKV